ncbi:MAG: hypothetical protein HKO77_08080, partial [Gemmatimonadetes bacterium]|nr:hypothetical protein [Gemmatimonadota bacterium]
MKESERRLVQSRILDVVRGVRWRWRARLALRGFVWMALLTGGVLLVSATVLEQLRFEPGAVVWLRVVTWATLALSFLLLFVRPLLR